MHDSGELVIKLLPLRRQRQNTAAPVGAAGGAGDHALLLQTVHDAVDRAGLHHQVPLQLLLVDLALRLVEVGQRPALHGRYVVLPQPPVHQFLHLMVAVAEQRAEMLRPFRDTAFHNVPPFELFRVLIIGVLNNSTVLFQCQERICAELMNNL